jgi:nicotinamidase-related amidase
LAFADPTRSALLVVDIQERFAPHIHEYERVVARSVQMVLAARAIGLPVFVTEQYPKGLGPTVPDLRTVLPEDCVPIAKTTFSCLGAPDLTERLEAAAIDTLFLVGIECHVCVLQTTLEALERGWTVHVVQDAVSSRHPENAAAGFARMAQAGAVISTSEMAIFELVRDAASPVFRRIQPLVK